MIVCMVLALELSSVLQKVHTPQTTESKALRRTLNLDLNTYDVGVSTSSVDGCLLLLTLMLYCICEAGLASSYSCEVSS